MKYLFSFWGKVRKGKNRGKRLGFPTANIRLHRKIPEGIYISETKIKQTSGIYSSSESGFAGESKSNSSRQARTIKYNIFPSLTFIGRAKTFNENLYQGETYIFSFNNSLYNQYISVKLIKKIRGNQKFNSEKELIKQMQSDKKIAGKFFKINV